MKKTIIIGTVALDDIETPFGNMKDLLGGSATYASYAASFFTKPGIVAVVGDDFPQQHIDLFNNRGICIKGLQKQGKTFRWQGYYEFDMNEAKTLKTELNALESFKPTLPEEYKDAEYVFLANIDPELQLMVIEQLKNPKLIIMDTMNFWIENKKDKVLEVINKSNIVLLNDGEARQLFNTTNLIQAANKTLELNTNTVIIKKGEHGALLFCDGKHFNAPGYPLENVKDPTGCGDTFGGSLLGYLAKTQDLSEPNIRKAIIYASAIASHNAEDFSLNNMKKITLEDINKRFNEMKTMREF